MDTFKHEALEVAKECIEECPRFSGGFVLGEMLISIEKRHAARLALNCDQYWTLSWRTRAFLRRNKMIYVRSPAEDVNGYLNANDWPACQTLRKLHSKPGLQLSTICKADGCNSSDMDGPYDHSLLQSQEGI